MDPNNVPTTTNSITPLTLDEWVQHHCPTLLDEMKGQIEATAVQVPFIDTTMRGLMATVRKEFDKRLDDLNTVVLVLMLITELPGFEPDEPYGKAVLQAIKNATKP